MRKNNLRALRLRACGALVISVCAASPLAAQTVFMFPFPTPTTSFDIRYLHILPNKGDMPILDGTIDISATIPANNRTSIIASLPMLHDTSATNSWSLGNIFCGVQIAADSLRRTVATLGMFLPTAKSTSSEIPIFVDRYELHRFAPKYLITYFNVAGRLAQAKDLTLRGEIGTNYFAAMNTGDTSTVLMHYGLALEIGAGETRFVFEYTGMVNFANSFFGIDDKLLNFIAVGATYYGKHFQPGVLIQLPMNQSLRSVVDGAIGVKVGYAL